MTETYDVPPEISKPELRKRLNYLRFRWHESIIADAYIRRFPTAILLAGYIMHRFKPDNGVAEFSHNGAAKALNMPVRSVYRAKNVLIERGWIRRSDDLSKRAFGWNANKYILTGGPEDLLLDVDPLGDSDDSPP